MTVRGRANLTPEQVAVLEQATVRYQLGRLTDQGFLGLLIDAGASAYQAGLALKQLRGLGTARRAG